MANKVTIDVEARFIDEVTGKTKYVISGLDDIGDAADDAQKSLDKVGKKKVNPILDVDNNKFLKKLNESENKAARLAGKTFTTTIKAVDKATAIANKVESGMRKLVGKTWSTVVKIKDYATAPLTKIKNMLFSMKSLALAIGAGLAGKQFVVNPISTADTIEQSKIAFETKLGSADAAEEFLQKIYKFDEKSPFDTTQIVGITQQMMNLGWTAENVLDDLGTIGDWSASLGKGTEGISSVTRALGQMRMKGRLSAEEMLQLTEAGVDAWNYVAEYMGKDITEIREMAEDGAIDVDTAIKAIMTGMGEYSGAAATQADRTVNGLIDQIKSMFKTYVSLPWGEGLSSGLKKGLVKIRDFVDENKDSLKDFGEMAKEIGEKITTWISDKVGAAIERIKQITSSAEFQSASLGKKISMLWKGVIANPFSDWWNDTVIPWWDGTAVPWLQKKASKLGKTIGTGLTKGLLALLGVDYGDAIEDGSSIAGGFVKGFLDGFDGSAITQAFVDAISNVWNALPWWAKILVGGYGTAKITSSIGNLIGGIAKFIGTTGGTTAAGTVINPSGLLGFIGSASKGTGLLGFGANAAINMGAGNLAGGASLSAGALSALGLTATAGLATGVATAISGGVDLYKGYKNDDDVAKESGGWKIGGAAGGAALGAAIGSIIPGVGTLVGAGIGALGGSLVGWLGSKNAKRQAVETAKLNGTLEELAASESVAAEEAQNLLKKQKKLAETSLAEHFGDIKLSANEMNDAIRNILGEDYLKSAESASASIQEMDNSFSNFAANDSSLKKDIWEATQKGAKMTEEDVSSLEASVESFGNSAKTYVTDAHYAATESVKAIMGNSEEAQKLIDSTNRYYKQQSNNLDRYQRQLKRELEKAISEDSDGGVTITVNEQKSLDEIRGKIGNIVQQIQEEEYEAEMNVIKAKWQTGDLSAESFGQMMTGAAEQASALAETYWDEFGRASVGKSEEQKETLRQGVMENLANIWGNTGDFGIGTIQERYAEELGFLGEDIGTILENNSVRAIMDAVDNLGPETQAGIGELMSKMEPTTEQIQSLVNSYEAAGMEVPEALSSYLETAEFYEALARGPEAIENYFRDQVVDIDPTFGNIDLELGEDIFGNLPARYVWDVEANANTAWTYDAFDDEWISPDGQYSFTTQGLVDAGWTYDTFNKQWISPNKEYTFTTDVVVTVNYDYITGSVTGNGNPQMNYASRQAQLFRARGGVIGGSSAMEAFALGGRPDDGMLKGSTRVIRVNEESPEMIIPLSSQRRERGLKLWEKTGELLDVPGFARGGKTSGGQDEGIRFRDYGQSESTGGQSIQVDVGGIVFEIHVNGTDAQSIAAAIKEQIADIAEDVAGVMADAFAAQFENTPVRGGAA